jgi:hypothetical protein
MSQDQPVLVRNSGLSRSKSRTVEIPPTDDLEKEQKKLEEQSHEENVFYFKTFIQSFEKKLNSLFKRNLSEAFEFIRKTDLKLDSVSQKMVCSSEKQILKNIDNFLFKTEPMMEEKESLFEESNQENQKIESIQQLEGFEEMESILRSALSKQISNKKNDAPNSKILFSTQKSNVQENVRGSNRSSKGLSVRVSVGSSFRGSGKSIQLQVASPINAGQLMKELIFSKKSTKGKNIKNENFNKFNEGGKGKKKDEIKEECLWNEASTKQSL